MSLALERRCELAPHASRSIAMALALSLNLALLLIALRPSTPYTLHVPPAQAVIATFIRPPPPKPPALPPTPTVRVAPRVMVPPVAITHPVTIPQVISPIAPVQAVPVTPATGPGTPTHAADTDATIAYASATPPPYPIDAIRAGAQGTVLLKVLVDASGKPVAVQIARTSGSRDLDIAARTHVLAAWRFHPAVRAGHAIEAWVMVPVKFDLNSLQ